MPTSFDPSTPQATLVGYQHQLMAITQKIAEIRRRLAGHATPLALNGTMPKRVLSAAARKRIAAAQRARWAKFHAERAAAPNQKAKRKMSAERRAALATNLAKARAARAAKRAAAATA
jgi:hypothetical protein